MRSVETREWNDELLGRIIGCVVVQMHNKLLELLDNGGIHRDTESFSTHPRSALQRLRVSLLFQSWREMRE